MPIADILRRTSRRSPAAPRRRSGAAFTFAELLVVMFIVATLAAVAAPTLSDSLDSMKATGLAREIATDMRYAQELAVKTGGRHRVSFWAPGQAYAVRRWEDDGGWVLCQHPITKKDWRPVLDEHSRYAGLTMKEARFGGSSNVIFDEYGSPDNGGYVRFALGDNTRTINVAPLSGKITVE